MGAPMGPHGTTWGPMGPPAGRPAGLSQLDTDLDISDLGFDKYLGHKRGGFPNLVLIWPIFGTKLDKNHENGSETRPYGRVWADIHTGWIPQALGSLWDASGSRASKPPRKIQKSRFSNIFLYFPIIPVQQQACVSGAGQKVGGRDATPGPRSPRLL